MTDLRFEMVGARLPPGFATLHAEAQAEGFTHLDRLARGWDSGNLRFDSDGERLLAAYGGTMLAGVGGLTREPTMPQRAMRMRRFYVRPAFRRQRVGAALVAALLDHARALGVDCVTVHAAREEAGRFWIACGFVPDARDGFTHLMQF